VTYIRAERTSRHGCGTRLITTLETAEQAQQSGWAAFDAGFDSTAIDLFEYCRRALARQSHPSVCTAASGSVMCGIAAYCGGCSMASVL
jgi:hypothetical protein